MVAVVIDAQAPNAGRDLDILVVEQVMGQCVHVLESKPSAYMQDPQRKGPYDWTMYECRKCQKRFMDKFTPYVPQYSTSIAEAWQLMEKLRQTHCCLTLRSDHDYIWECYGIRNEDDAEHEIEAIVTYKIYAMAKTAPHAICLAALKAVRL